MLDKNTESSSKMVDVVKEVVVPATTEQTVDMAAAAQLITFFESFVGDQINEYQKSMLEYFSNKVKHQTMIKRSISINIIINKQATQMRLL